MTLKEFFTKNNKVAIGFSGGVDSAYLLYEAVNCGCDVTAYYVNAEFQPQFELDDAMKLAAQLNAKIKVLEVNALEDEQVKANGPKRCYFCKKKIFSAIMNAAMEDGYRVLLDGTNASDEVSDRPGMQAIKELNVLSPLRECGLTKAEIRRLSKEAGLFTWNKPAYACLATRIPVNTPITREDLMITEKAEAELMKMGFSDFRIRKIGNTAKIQVTADQLGKVIQERSDITSVLKKYYESITLDLEVR